MACRVLENSDGLCCFYDSVTDVAFGPIMDEGVEFALAFADWLRTRGTYSNFQKGFKDPRIVEVNELIGLCGEFRELAKRCKVCDFWKISLDNNQICDDCKD